MTAPPPPLETTRPVGSGLTLWQFLLALLNSPEYREIIQWTGRDKEFKLIDAERVAQLWGEHKNKPRMSYDKLSRALRYYYEKNIIQKVDRQRYVYRFVLLPNTTTMTTLTPPSPRATSASSHHPSTRPAESAGRADEPPKPPPTPALFRPYDLPEKRPERKLSPLSVTDPPFLALPTPESSPSLVLDSPVDFRISSRIGKRKHSLERESVDEPDAKNARQPAMSSLGDRRKAPPPLCVASVSQQQQQTQLPLFPSPLSASAIFPSVLMSPTPVTPPISPAAATLMMLHRNFGLIQNLIASQQHQQQQGSRFLFPSPASSPAGLLPSPLQPAFSKDLRPTNSAKSFIF